MKTVDEKALDIVREYHSLPLHGRTLEEMGCQAMAQLQCLIVDALKQQDRETRNACVNAIMALPCCEEEELMRNMACSACVEEVK